MKRTFVVALATLTLGLTSIHAQQAATPVATPAPAPAPAPAAAPAKTDFGAKHAANLQKKLNLNDSQTAQIKDLFNQEHQDFAKLGKNATKEQRSELQKQYHEKVLSVMTPDQQKAYEEMLKEHKKAK